MPRCGGVDAESRFILELNKNTDWNKNNHFMEIIDASKNDEGLTSRDWHRVVLTRRTPPLL